MEQQQEKKPEESMSEEEALMKIAQAMKDNAPTQDEKHNVHEFLDNVAKAEDTSKIGNLRDDKDINELGIPSYPVRALKDMALISKRIMNNLYFENYFNEEAENVLATSLSREGFLIRQATIQTKQVADVTKRRKINKGWFGNKTTEESGGDTTKN